MAQKGLHWSERQPDPNVRECKPYVTHINQPRISAETMLKLVNLRNKLTGEHKSVYEASVLAEQNQA